MWAVECYRCEGELLLGYGGCYLDVGGCHLDVGGYYLDVGGGIIMMWMRGGALLLRLLNGICG